MIYEDKTGYIKGYLREDGYYWISEFLIYPEYRGRGFARKLASHMPRKAKLLCYPLMKQGSDILQLDALVAFYKSLGFAPIRIVCGATDMVRD